MTARTAAPLVSLAIAGSLLLGGCSLLPPLPFLPDGSSDDGGSSSGSNGDSDIDENPFLDHEVPDTFPVDDVPLPDLDIVFSLDLGTGWSIVYHSDDIEADHNAIADLYDEAGFESLANETADGMTLGIYESDGYQVQVSGTDNSDDYDGPVLAFTVVAKS